MTVFVALLRAVNVSGTGMIRMADLKALCDGLGFADTETLVQSGNLVFTAKGSDKIVADKLGAAIEASHGFRPAVMVRTAAEMAGVVNRNPFKAAAKDDPRFVIAGFMSGKPSAGAAERIAAVKVVREKLVLSGTELFVHYADGQGRSKVTNAVLERALGVPVTARNWNTVTRLAAMAAARA